MRTTKKWNHQLGVSLGDGPLGKNHHVWSENGPQRRIPKQQIWKPPPGEALGALPIFMTGGIVLPDHWGGGRLVALEKKPW